MAEYRGKKKRYEPTAEERLAEGIFSVLATLGRFVVSLFMRKGGGSSAPTSAAYRQRVQELQDAWWNVEQHAALPATKALAISEADKVLDSALQLKGVAGSSMGERLKHAGALFPHELYQSVWAAHKLRNQLAHELNANPSEHEVHAALQTFQSALRHLSILQ